MLGAAVCAAVAVAASLGLPPLSLLRTHVRELPLPVPAPAAAPSGSAVTPSPHQEAGEHQEPQRLHPGDLRLKVCGRDNHGNGKNQNDWAQEFGNPNFQFNLLLNAAQAMNGKGRIEVTVETTDAWCEIAVRDNGPGFDGDIRDKLFEPFFSTKHRGSGLGLSTAKRVVEMHHGTLTAESGDGGGAVMRIRLPRW